MLGNSERTEPLDLSIVIPVYGCVGCLEALHQRLIKACREITDRFEIVYVDDRSPDGAWDVLKGLTTDGCGRAIRLTRNFGQQAAITAGLEHARGRWTVVMDCDLEDPPELIPKLWEKAHSGFEVVMARRKAVKQSLHRRIGARLYFWSLRRFLGITINPSYGSFSILSARARAAFLEVRDADRHYVPILAWIGFEQGEIEYTHAERYAGESAYSFRDLLKVAGEGVFFQTTTLLRYVVYLGFVISAIGLLLAAFFIYSYLVNDTPPGFTSTAVLIICLSGFIIVSMGVTGLYIGKIFQQVKARPLYLVDEAVGAAETTQYELAEKTT